MTRCVDGYLGPQAMPLISFQAMRDGMARDNRAGPNAISYFSRPQDWHLQITTPNNNTLYAWRSLKCNAKQRGHE